MSSFLSASDLSGDGASKYDFKGFPDACADSESSANKGIFVCTASTCLSLEKPSGSFLSFSVGSGGLSSDEITLAVSQSLGTFWMILSWFGWTSSVY